MTPGLRRPDRLDVAVRAVGEVLLSERQRRPQLLVAAGKVERRRHDADDRVGRAVEVDRPAQHARRRRRTAIATGRG